MPFRFICSLDEGDDPLKIIMLGKLLTRQLVTLFFLIICASRSQDARGMPAKESLVRRLNFCQWVDAENPWISGDIWMACEKDISIEQLRVKPALAVWIYRVNVTLHRCLFIFLTSV